MSQPVNNPGVIGILVIIAIAGAIVVLVTSIVLHKIDAFRERRNDNQVFKAAREARRDFR